MLLLHLEVGLTAELPADALAVADDALDTQLQVSHPERFRDVGISTCLISHILVFIRGLRRQHDNGQLRIVF